MVRVWKTFALSAIGYLSCFCPVLAASDGTPPPNLIPTDLTPLSISPGREIPSRSLRFKVLQALPERVWLQSSTEVHQRLDTNVLFTHGHQKADYAFRINPNVSLGYNFLPSSTIYGSYFAIKDLFAYNKKLNFPTTQSMALGLRHDHQIGERSNIQFDIQARQLWLNTNSQVFDLIPAINLSTQVNPNTSLFGSALLQLRGLQYMEPAEREVDPFYSVGIYRKIGDYNLLLTNTFTNNFRYNQQTRTSLSMISGAEVNRPVSRNLKGVVAFVRCEPVWNFGAGKDPGLSGFDFRLIGGMRMSVAKPAYNASIDRLRQQLIQQERTAR